MAASRFPRSVQAVIFDMDGVLVDTEGLFRDAFIEESRARGRDLPLEVFLSMVGAPREQNARVAQAHFGPDFDVEAWTDGASARAVSRMTEGPPLKPGVLEILDFLETAGVPRAVATSSGPAGIDRQLGPWGLPARFQALVARGDYVRGKPHPEPFLLAASRLGVAPEDCLALEDSYNGVRAAAAAGMMTVMVPDLLAPTPEIEALCVAVARDLDEVRGWLAAAGPN